MLIDRVAELTTAPPHTHTHKEELDTEGFSLELGSSFTVKAFRLCACKSQTSHSEGRLITTLVCSQAHTQIFNSVTGPPPTQTGAAAPARPSFATDRNLQR